MLRNSLRNVTSVYGGHSCCASIAVEFLDPIPIPIPHLSSITR
jgi:hypothetical protein